MSPSTATFGVNEDVKPSPSNRRRRPPLAVTDVLDVDLDLEPDLDPALDIDGDVDL